MIDRPVPASAHPGVEAAHAAIFAPPHRAWWTHAAPERSLAEQLAAAVAAGVPFIADISEHNGTVDWDLLEQAYRAGLLLAVAMRAGFGTVRADAQFFRNRDEARRRGIPAIFYWFCYSAYNRAVDEAGMFNATVGALRPGEAMAGDFEDDPQAKPFLRGAAGLRWCQDFLTAVQAPRNATWGYSYPALISTIGLQPLWQTWPFWLADWSRTADSVFGYAALRQFTNCGSTPGVAGCCDQSRVLQAPLSRWLTPGGAPAPAITTTGAFAVGSTTAVLYHKGVRHTFEISNDLSAADVPGPAGDLLWGRTTGGEGGAVHVGFWRMGGSGEEGGIVDLAVGVNPDLDRIDIRAKFGPSDSRSLPGGGLVLELALDANATTKEAAVAVTWTQPDNAGPFRVPVAQGQVLPRAMVVNAPPGPQGEPGPPVSADEVAEVVKAVVKSAAAAL